ncbi:Oxygen-independent coproporphyrinogen-III oxidase-like protein [Planctomycetes bacterium Poly30]|uniref:Heme chaperone HemW n=1 Tax=Saltatorellus ferox TaxID=2528018 RepID=A0A518F189_9BACT|nr:Oxygen-independent coproporphyrinogen-III oxidase-like protein [Planctomycetes bacterium Poly30]
MSSTEESFAARQGKPRAAALDRAEDGVALYVHLPFCAAKCHYCDFFSVPDDGQDIDGMIAAILEEARLRAPLRPRTVFIGGGTPSLLSIEQLTRFLDGLDELVGWRDSATEVSAECNPESLDRDKAKALLDLGVPRLSIGFQTLNDETLKLFGRVHSVDDSFRAFEAARAAGIEHLNLDMIYAVPGQTAADWARDLGRVLDLGPEHLSAYNLTFEEDTRFKRWLDQGKLASSPEEVELEMFHTTRELTAAAGLAAYEISNHARPGEACAHNVGYWRNAQYVGIGPGAVSKVGQARAGNPRAIQPYLRRMQTAGHATDWREDPDVHARLAETWWLGLRLTEGVNPERARETAGLTDAEEDPHLATAHLLIDQGFLETQLRDGATYYRLTASGLPLADAVARQFLK